MPIGLGVPDGEISPGVARWEAIANGDGARRKGANWKLPNCSDFCAQQQVRDFVFLTADVHYCAAHHYHPDQCGVSGFRPVLGVCRRAAECRAVTGLIPLDKTFGPEVVFEKAPPAQNTSPFAGFQFFGEVNIEGQSGEMSVMLRDLDGVSVFEKKLQPANQA